mmetsp:Transcript_59944/g.131592  ORF Transcript_59944/g.131592 Transcript_59944/m.131592 type:complete len:191 (+) Transcript_59944:61-633(+)
MSKSRHGGALVARFLVLCALVVLHGTLLSFVLAPVPTREPSPTDGRMRRRAVLLGEGLLAALAPAMDPAHAEGSCSADDVKLWEGGLKSTIDKAVLGCVMLGPPGGREGGCIQKFGASSGPPDQDKVCMSSCVEKTVGLSKPCSDCFGALSQCTFQKCAMKCIDEKAPECKACGKEFCAGAAETCSGLKL